MNEWSGAQPLSPRLSYRWFTFLGTLRKSACSSSSPVLPPTPTVMQTKQLLYFIWIPVSICEVFSLTVTLVFLTVVSSSGTFYSPLSVPWIRSFCASIVNVQVTPKESNSGQESQGRVSNELWPALLLPIRSTGLAGEGQGCVFWMLLPRHQEVFPKSVLR